MTTFTVHEALIPPRELGRRADDIVFIKEGFSWWAFVAPLPWLLYQRLWLEAVAYVVVAILLAAAVMATPGGQMSTQIVFLLLNILIGFEANDLRRWAMERNGRNLVAMVVGRSFDECERRFFEAWLPFARQDQARRWSNPPAGGGGGAGQSSITARPADEAGAMPVARVTPRAGRDGIIGFPGEGG